MESESYRDTVRTTRKEERKVVAYVKLGLLLSKLHVKTQNLYFQYWKKESVRQKQREIHFSVLSKHDSGPKYRSTAKFVEDQGKYQYLFLTIKNAQLRILRNAFTVIKEESSRKVLLSTYFNFVAQTRGNKG